MSKAATAGGPAERKPAGLPYSIEEQSHLGVFWVMRGEDRVAVYATKAAAKRYAERQLALRKVQEGKG